MDRPDHFRYIINNASEPIVFKNILNWPIIHWDLKKWEEVLHDEKLPFRCGKNAHTKNPQWERTTDIVTKTFSEFLEFSKTENQGTWMYFDYKYLAEWFQNIQEIRQHIDWSQFGLSNMSPDESTIWIGSKGAHTPCHIDTYGCNLIAQVHGRKQWILFPPEEDLKPTRIPYEESSIYSKINFFSPNLPTDEIPSTNCWEIVLEAGDVLFVPHKWWHYVENLETSISVNTWIPLEGTDDKERLSESIVNFLITQLAKNLNNSQRRFILNPNSDEDASSMSMDQSLKLIKTAKERVLQMNKNKRRTNETKSVGESDGAELSISQVFAKYSENLNRIPKLSAEEFKEFLTSQSCRFHKADKEETCDNVDELVALLEVVSNSEVVHSIMQNLIK